MSSLKEIGLKWRPSKIQHSYLGFMDFHFSQLRTTAKKVLEIGVQTNRSVKMWEEYFPNAEIYGLDIDEKCKQYEEGRVKIVIGDQSDENVLKTLPNDFDVIIDDGSHIESHVIKTLNYLYQNKLKIGGIYCIEDMLLSRHHRLRTLIAHFITGINYCNPPNYKGPWSQLNHYEDKLDFKIKFTTGIHIYKFLTFIDKKRNPEDGEAKIRLAYPNICRENELICYGKELNNWSHLENTELVSKFGANKCYGDF